MTRRKRKGQQRTRWNVDRYWQTAAYNENLRGMLFDDIMQLALSRFKWVDLPETCDEWYLEWCLVHDGCATIAQPSSHPGTFLSLTAVTKDAPNMYNRPKRWRALGATGRTNFDVTPANGVYVYDNKTRYPLVNKISMWSRELADIIRVKQINRYHMRMPVIMTGASERTFDMQNIVKQMGQGEPVIIGTDGLDSIDVKVWNTDIEFIGDQLQAEYENTWNNIYRMLGIRNLPFKSERRIEDEVLSDRKPSELSALASLECRRDAVEKLNRRFGLDVKVVLNSDLQSQNYDTLHSLDQYMRTFADASDSGSNQFETQRGESHASDS